MDYSKSKSTQESTADIYYMAKSSIIRKLTALTVALFATLSLSGCYEVSMIANVDKSGYIVDSSLEIQLHQSAIDLYNRQYPDVAIDMNEATFKKGIEDFVKQSSKSSTEKALLKDCVYSTDNSTYKALCSYSPKSKTLVNEILSMEEGSSTISDKGQLIINGIVKKGYNNMDSTIQNLFSFHTTLTFATEVQYVSGKGLTINPLDKKMVTIDYVESSGEELTIITKPYVDYLIWTIFGISFILLMVMLFAIRAYREKRAEIPRYV